MPDTGTKPSIASSEDAGPSVGVGFIGVGGRGRALLQSLLTVPGVQVRAVCDTDSGNRTKANAVIVKAGQDAPVESSDWKELLALPGIDAIASALPCDLHHRAYLDTIAAGKDLYGEKPMCLSVAECDDIIRAAEQSGRIVQIGFQRRADPRFVETMGLVHGGELGDLVEARICWSNAWGPLYDWFGHRERSGDWMIEQAVHNWDVLNWALQCLPVRATGMGRKGLYSEKQPDRDVTDYYSALVEYENGVIVNIMHSWVAPGQSGAYNRAFNDEYTRLVGTRAGLDFNTGKLSHRQELNIPDRIEHSFKGEMDSTQLGLAAFIDSVRTRKPPVATAAHGRDAVLSCLLVRAAVERGGEITMSELTQG